MSVFAGNLSADERTTGWWTADLRRRPQDAEGAMIDEKTKTEFLSALTDVRTHAERLLEALRAGRGSDWPETENELTKVLRELRDVEETVRRGESPRGDRGRRRLLAMQIAFDWNYSDLANRVVALDDLYNAL
jgi:hypothetical protein